MNTSSDAPRWCVPGDWSGFFGLFTNVVLNVIVLTGLCLHVVNLPADIVYGRILPALGIALPLGNLYYAYLAWRLAKDEGRDDVTIGDIGPLLVTAVPLGIYNFTEGMNNVESAAVAGDDYNLRRSCWPTAPARSSVRCWAVRSRPPSTSATPDGRQWADGSGIRCRPASSSASSASSG